MKKKTFALKKKLVLLVKVSMISLLISSTIFIIAQEQNSFLESNNSELIRLFNSTLLINTNDIESNEMCSEALLDSLVILPERFIRSLSQMPDSCLLSVCKVISEPVNDKVNVEKLQELICLLSYKTSYLKTRILVMSALQYAKKRYN